MDHTISMMYRKISIRAASAALTLLLLLAACDFVGEDTKGRGTLRLLLTDAPFPFDLVQEANVTIERIDIIRADDAANDAADDAADDAAPADGDPDVEVEVVLDEDRRFNLLDLRNGVTAMLGDVELREGRYAQLRIIVRDADIVLKDGRTFDMKVPSGAQTGIKVLLNDLEVAEGAVTELTLDFDVSESFIVQGSTTSAAGIKGFLFKPVIKPIRYKAPRDDAADDLPTDGASAQETDPSAAES